jgi:hypothetical protein
LDAIIKQLDLARSNNQDSKMPLDGEYKEYERLCLDYNAQESVVNCLLSQYQNGGFDGNEHVIQEFVRLAEIAEEIEREAAAHNIH